MKCGVLTFSFAYNYGALLQAKSLKNFIEKNGHEANIISYAPKHTLCGYSLNPFVGTLSIKSIVYNFLRLPFRFFQYKRFDEFICDLHGGEKIFSDDDTLYNVEKKYDALVVGSDQVWNDSITGTSDAYFFPKEMKNVLKISYAASFGKKELSSFQEKCVEKYLSKFYSLSLREEDGMEKLVTLTQKDVKIVLDPVFLSNDREWNLMSGKSRLKLNERYILFYSLSSNLNLVNLVNKISEELKIGIISIHPTAKKSHINGKQLFNVGPYEFLKLIKDAEIVCTDSFHATAFSVIFKKKFAHIVKRNNESRVESLLSRLNAYSCLEKGMNNIIDFANIDEKILNRLIDESKTYLQGALSKNK